MGSFSIWHWIIILAYLVVLFIPAAKILKRTGHSPFWALVLIVPVVNIVLYWVFAFKKWPADNESLS